MQSMDRITRLQKAKPTESLIVSRFECLANKGREHQHFFEFRTLNLEERAMIDARIDGVFPTLLKHSPRRCGWTANAQVAKWLVELFDTLKPLFCQGDK
jgi:hypothetical protein